MLEIYPRVTLFLIDPMVSCLFIQELLTMVGIFFMMLIIIIL